MSLPHLPPSIYSQFLGGKSKKERQRGPRIPGSVHPPPTRVNARRRKKGQKLPERVRAAAGVGGTASVVWCTCRRKEGGGVAVRLKLGGTGGTGVPGEVPGCDNNLVDRVQAVNRDKHRGVIK